MVKDKKHKEQEYQKIHLKILEKIVPTQQEREKLKQQFQAMTQEIAQTLEENNIQAEIELTGSFARDTWLAGNRDLDIFVILPYTSKLSPEDILSVIKEHFDLPWEKKHAQHPYLATIKEGLDIEIIPCYEYQPGRPLRSPMDRSPRHTKFVTNNLPTGREADVRLLKQFMRGIGTYGAEIAIKGFSGYLLELLVIYYEGEFLRVLKNAPSLPGAILTFEEKQKVKKEDFQDDAFIVVDPTDEQRNVAAAVSEETLAEFIAAATRYLKHPSEAFFFPEITRNRKEMLEQLQKTPLQVTILHHSRPEIVDDVLWGQIRKFEESLHHFLEEEKMQPITVDSLVKEGQIFTVIVSQKNMLPTFQWRKGPPVGNRGQEQFLQKYQKYPRVVYGPVVMNKRWRVLLKNLPLELDRVIIQAIQQQKIALPSYLQLAKEQIRLIVQREELLIVAARDQALLKFLYKTMRGKPLYL
ncbi:MAG: CCA tRNA nucleotidyltransferase [Candidatus Heimdallarchaeota archaeon]|nr:CCA tRNA nucleotidyltransferase [Candidatus Heimdallarchaeota archaeon]